MDRNTKEWVQRTLENFRVQLNKVLEEAQLRLTAREHIFNASWNTMNVVVRIVEDIGRKNGLWNTREEYMEYFKRVGEELVTEHQAHQEAERERVRKEQAEGKTPAPIDPGELPMDQANAVVIDITSRLNPDAE